MDLMPVIGAVIVCSSVATLGALAHHGFLAWLQQRERERLSAIDKAELNKRMDAYEAKMLELKNIIAGTRTR